MGMWRERRRKEQDEPPPPARAPQGPPGLALPEPDQFYNYWFGDDKHGTARPVILHSGGGEAFPKLPEGKFFASTGPDGPGVLADKDGVRYFDTPDEALAALRRAGAFRS